MRGGNPGALRIMLVRAILRSNQRSESLHSRIQFNLDWKMTLLELFQHFDNCLVNLFTREANLDFVSNYKPCLKPDASFFVHEAAKRFTTSLFYDDVLSSLKAAEKCYLIEEIDAYNIVEYIVARVDKGEK
jgi:zinc finger SWIM domain-containing protein 3